MKDFLSVFSLGWNFFSEKEKTVVDTRWYALIMISLKKNIFFPNPSKEAKLDFRGIKSANKFSNHF